MLISPRFLFIQGVVFLSIRNNISVYPRHFGCVRKNLCFLVFYQIVFLLGLACRLWSYLGGFGFSDSWIFRVCVAVCWSGWLHSTVGPLLTLMVLADKAEWVSLNQGARYLFSGEASIVWGPWWWSFLLARCFLYGCHFPVPSADSGLGREVSDIWKKRSCLG